MLEQPILSENPEVGHPYNDYLCFNDFILLLKLEEEYFKGEEYNVKLIISRLRKIFYDKGGWDILIKKAVGIEGRYKVNIVDCSDLNELAAIGLKKVKWYENNVEKPKCRKVTYRADDRIFGSSRAGEIPYIYINDHADIKLPENYFCDIAHTLAGLDALNNIQVVSPLPNWLLYFYRYFIYVNSNADFATWLGDIATSGTDFLFKYLRNKRINTCEEEQESINKNASASDMLGNIDAFVINKLHNTDSCNGKRVTEIFTDYYTSKLCRKDKFEFFCEIVGLKDWDGNNFSNEQDWLNLYTNQLRNATAIMVVLFSGNLVQKYILPIRVWKGQYDHIIKSKTLLEIFLKKLKELIQ